MKKTVKTTIPALEAAVETCKTATTKKTSTAKPVRKKVSAETEKEVATKITAEAVASKREVKYIYPDGVRADRDASKKFRTAVRRKVASFTQSLENLKKSKLPEDVELYTKKFEEFENYKKEVYVGYKPIEEVKSEKPTIVKKRKKVIA